jgi:leader peptidase (prepilin peptidase)/N-methyltransferase
MTKYGETSLSIMQDNPAALSLRPDLPTMILGTSAASLLSCIFLPWPAAIASSFLALLMIAGADVDARTFLLPDTVTYGAILSGLIAALLLESFDPWASFAAALLRALGTSALLMVLRTLYARLRGYEGLGLGDVKLAAGIGAWLPLESIPVCFSLAATAALLSILSRFGSAPLKTLKLPLGTYLCPALWLVFFVNSLPR